MWNQARWCLGILVAVLGPAAQAAEPWEKPFAGDAQAVLHAAGRITAAEGTGVVVLLEEHHYAIDKSGRAIASVRRVYRLLQQDAVELWASVEQEYAPWYELRPEFRARVIRSDGTVHWLDPKTIADSPAQEFDSSIFSDRRVLRAPLPAVSAGAVVEYEITVRETVPLLDAGTVRRVTIPDSAPIERFRLSIEAAKGVPLRTGSRHIPDAAVRRSETGRSTHIKLEMGPIAARESWEGNLPFQESLQPYFAFSTGQTWQAVATRYEEIVNRQIQAADLRPLLEGVDLSGPPLEVAARLTARLHKEIRYTGVEFGEAAIVPRTPAEVLQRKYGDCKDKSALLVALLRAAGMRADVALLSAGFHTDVGADLPGLGQFNHAIVHVAAANPVWIDATSPETRVGELPLQDQGRLALIANRHATALVTIGSSTAAGNQRIHSVEIRMSEFGLGEIRETVQASGYLETRMREVYAARDEKSRRENLEAYVKSDFQAKSLGPFAVTAKDDFSSPFHLSVHALQAKTVTTMQDEGFAVLHPYLVFEELPYPLSGVFLEEDDEEAKPRQHDFIFYGPHQIEYRYRIIPARSFRPRALPESKEISLGAARYSQKYKTLEDGSVQAVFRFDSGKQRLSPAEFEALRTALQEHNQRVPEMITFVSEGAELVAVGQTGKALKLVAENAAKDADNPAAQVRLSRLLVTAGAMESAFATARKITEATPDLSAGWQALGWAHQHDSFGRRFRGDWNRAEAERCYREAIRLDPADMVARVDLAILLEHNARGRRYGSGAQLDEAISLYREVLKEVPEPQIQINLVMALVRARQYPEAKEAIKRVPDGELHAVLLLTVTALSEGPARAIIASQTAAPDNQSRAVALARAGQTLIQFREYAQGIDLLKAAARLRNVAQAERGIENLSKMKRYEGVLLPPSDPRYPVQRLLMLTATGPPDPTSVRPLLSKRIPEGGLDRWLAKTRSGVASSRSLILAAGMDEENLLDGALSAVTLDQRGDDQRGYRIGVVNARDLPSTAEAYVVLEDGEYRILGDPSYVAGIGEMVLKLLEGGDFTTPQWWLDTVVPDLRPESPYGTGGPAVRLLWSGVTSETRGPDAIRVAAASMVGRHTSSQKAVQILRQAHARATVSLVRSQIDLALCESLETAEQWKELLAVGRRLAATNLFSGDGFRCMARAAVGLQDWQTLKAEARRRLSDRNPTDALRALAAAHLQTGDRAGAAEYLKQQATSVFATEEDRVQEAWNLMLAGQADEELLARYVHDERLAVRYSSNYWYTLGMLQAFLGKPEEAYRSLTRALDDDHASFDAKPWAVLAWILDNYGLSDAANSARGKMRAAASRDDVARWAVELVSGNQETRVAP